MICILLNLLGLVLWPTMCSVLVNAPGELEKKVYSAVVEVFCRCLLHSADGAAVQFNEIFIDFLPTASANY